MYKCTIQPGKCFVNKRTFLFCSLTEVKFSFYEQSKQAPIRTGLVYHAGALTQLDISPDDILWGVNSAGNIYIRNGWSRVIGGALKHVTVGKAGVWGVNAGRNIYYRNGVTSSNLKGSSWQGIF